MKAVVAAFNQEKALVGASSMITNLRMDLFESLVESGFTALVVPSLIAATSPPVILDTYWLRTKLLLVPTYHTIAGNHFRPPHRLLQIFWDLILSGDFLPNI